MATDNAAWHLEDFVDSLVVELDKTRETLAVKAINKPLSYTVKDLALDLNIFPTYDGDQVRFVTAQPGESGASKVTIQLGSITDQQVRATSKAPAKSEVALDDIPVPKATRKRLRTLGVNSVEDLNAIERKNVDLRKTGEKDIDYSELANQIKKARRNRQPPKVKAVTLTRDEQNEPCLVVRGERLAIDPGYQPVAVVNQALAEVLSSSDSEIRIKLRPNTRLARNNELIVTFDPFAIMKANVKV